MISLNIQIPESVAAEFYTAADRLNRRFDTERPRAPGEPPLIDAKTLMAFALGRHEADDVCAQFDLAIRVVRGTAAPPFNPALK